MKIWTIALACCLAMASLQAEAAKRLGGGGSIGRQSSNVTQRQQSAPVPATPTTAGATTGTPAQVPAATKPATAQPAPATAPAPAPKRPWGAMLGGLAAGLGLAWLAHSLGMGAEFGQFLMFALLALVLVSVVAMVMRSRREQQRPAYQGAAVEMAAAPRQYSPDKVGNDASARPWEQPSATFEPPPASGSGIRIGSALAGSQDWGIPAGFDTAGFVDAAKRNFVILQDAWDRGDIPALRAMMTDEMVREISGQLAQRQPVAKQDKTEVVMLEAQLLGIEDLGDAWMASVEFSGLLREEPSSGPSPFREAWNMTKAKDGASGWLVAGVQALQ